MDDDSWKCELRCPVCGKAFASYPSMMAHMGQHPMTEQVVAPATPPPLEIGVTSTDHLVVVVEEEKRSGKKDLLPWPVTTKKRSAANRYKALVVFEVGEPSNPPPPPPPIARNETELAISALGSWDLMELPFKKRLLMVVRGRKQNQFLCITCGKAFTSYHALGGHSAHHKRKDHKSPASSMKEETSNVKGTLKVDDKEVVVSAPPQPRKRRCVGGARQCLKCGREFSTPQGLGGHQRHCKGQLPPPPPAQGPPLPPAQSKTKVIQLFDLNELPPPEEEDGMVFLPWHDRDGNGAAGGR